MDTTTSIYVLRESLEEKVEKEFIELIRESREQRLESFHSALQPLDTLRESDENDPSVLLDAVHDVLESLRAQLNTDGEHHIADIYPVAVYQLAGSLQDSAVINQHIDRFRTLENDSLFLKAAKALKNMIRSIDIMIKSGINFLRRNSDKAPKEAHQWTQKIPVRKVIEYHLFSRNELPKWWINEDERLLVNIVIKLQDFLADDFDPLQPAHSAKAMAELVEQLHKQIDEQKSSLAEDLEEDSRAMQEMLVHHFERADTLEKRASFYSRARIDRTKNRASDHLADFSKQWKEAHESLLDRTGVVAGFWQFRSALYNHVQELKTRLNRYFEDSLFTPIQELGQQLEHEQNELEKVEAKDKTSAQKAILETALKNLTRQADTLQEGINESLEKGSLDKIVQDFSDKVLSESGEIPENVRFVHDLDLDKNPPALDSEQIDWRQMVIRVLKKQLLTPLMPPQQQYEEFLRLQLNEVIEIREVIDVNLNSALELLDDSGEENPISIAREGLERSEHKLEQSASAARETHQKLLSLIQENGYSSTDQLLNLLHTGEPGDLQILDATYRVKETADNWRTILSARWARLQDSVSILGRLGRSKTKKKARTLNRFLGFGEESPPEEKKADIANYLSKTDARVEELPYIYRRLFNFDASTDQRFYVLPNGNFLNLGKAYESWTKDLPASIAIVGERGSGKTAYLNMALNDVLAETHRSHITISKTIWTREHCITLLCEQLDLKKTDSVEGIIGALNRRTKRNIVVVEALQNLYLRSLNGYEALKTLLYIITETKDSIFWIVTCSSYAWHFLQKTSSVADYFSHVIRSDDLSREQIKSVILKRHEASGYDLVFEADETQQKNRAYRKLLDREQEAQQYLEDQYFEKLSKLAEGNASIAMIFWLRSIRDFDDTHFYIRPLEVTSVELVEDLTPDILFTLAAMVLHDTLTPQQLSRVLLFNEQESKLMLSRLKSRGLLNQSGPNYSLNQLMYRQVVNVLKQRNIIHLY
ncbi:hypothetical protein [Halalkalibaculum sp. DA384]|uniref:hypothetical protein n=1 Tax=Halalkalibaculum sp. DA384 TaxID=3373606 RepID=UPI003754F482